jgi:fatty acid desaturase
MTPRRYWWFVFGLPLTGWFHYEYLSTLFLEFWTSPTSYPSKVIYWSVVLTTVQLYGKWPGFAMYYIVPVFGILPVTRWWAELGEHLGLDMTGNFGNSRTNDGFWQRWWIYPLNDGLHAAHHLNSQVPCYRLRRVHKELLTEIAEFRTKNQFSNGVLETFRQIIAAPTVVREGTGGTAEWNKGQLWTKPTN